MNTTSADFWHAQFEQAPSLFARQRVFHHAHRCAILTVDSTDQYEYQFHFEDDSVLCVNQSTGESVVHFEGV